MALNQYDVVVVGAGVIGAATALVMYQLGYRVLLSDSAAETTEMPENIRAAAISIKAAQLLKDLGIWQNLMASQMCPYTAMKVWDENSSGQIDFEAEELGCSELGYICDHFALQRLLQQACINSGMDTQFNSKLVGVKNYQTEQVDQDSVELEFDNNIIFHAKLLIAADGVRSFVREHIGIQTQRQNYQQTAIVTQVKTTKPHQSAAWQRFLGTGPLAFLPLSNGNSSIVWSVDHSIAADLLGLSDADFSQQISFAFQHRLGDAVVQGKRFSFPLNSIQARDYLKGQVLLIGDAAHGIHPLAGQGANLGFADIIALRQSLSGRPELDKCRKQLRSFERQRKAKNYATNSAMTLINDTFLTNVTALSLGRGFGMNIINQRSYLKSVLADFAMYS